MADSFDGQIEARLAALIERLSPSSRTALARAIATQLRATQSARIAAQKNPDGSAFEPRKPQLRRKKKNLRREASPSPGRAAMFNKLRTNTWLKTKSTADGAVIAFTNDVARIARVHQLGLRDRVNRKTNLEADYPARQLLGLTPIEEALIDTLISNHLADAL